MQLGLTALLILFLSPMLLHHRSVPFARSSRRIEVVRVFIPEQGYFQHLCREQWKDHCIELYKDLPIWPDQWEGEESFFLKLKLDEYLKKKGIKSYVLKKEELDLR